MNEPISDAPSSSRIPRPSWMGDVVPFLTSLSLHATLIVVGLLTYQAIKVVRGQPLEEMTFTADSPIVMSESAQDGMRNVGPDNNPLKKAMQSETADDTRNFVATHRASSNAQLGEIGGGAGSDGGAGSFSAGARGAAFGSGDKDGQDGPSGGPFGIGSGGAHGQLGTGLVFTKVAGAHKIAFLCDASGSMITKIAALKAELARAVESLKPSQSFNVIFFQDQSCKSFSPELSAASPSNTRRAIQFLEDVVTTGETNPIPALELAFRQKPEIIYFLTDGDFPDNDAVLRKIQTLNAGGHVRINTIALVGSGDTDTGFIALLKKVAQATHGTYRHVSEDDLR